MNASEAIYGFCGWLTSREEKTVMSSGDDCAPIADLIEKFCNTNNLEDVTDDWLNNLTIPKE